MIESVIVSINYADYLRQSLPYVKDFSDRVLVVSAPQDSQTREVCETLGVTCLLTDSHNLAGGFNKGAAINAGLSAISRLGWVLLIDADIVPFPRAKLDLESLRPDFLYGAYRTRCDSPVAMQRFAGDATIFPPQPPPPGCVDPLGYFQLWHGDAVDGPWFSEATPRADKTDILFARRWDWKTRFLPDPVVHLDIDGHCNGSNWKGRVSKKWKNS